MTKTYFLSLSECSQQALISESGKLIINYIQGEVSIQVYRVKEVFVKILLHNDGKKLLEVYGELNDLKLYETIY